MVASFKNKIWIELLKKTQERQQDCKVFTTSYVSPHLKSCTPIFNAFKISIMIGVNVKG